MDGVEFDVKFKIDEVESRMKKIEDSIGNVANNTDKHTKRMGTAFNNVTGEANKLDQTINRIGASILTYLSVNAMIGVGRSIIDVRSEFEKFTAVLTTAYGDVDKANRAMDMLKETAKETPFQLTELAQAFVLLKNRGVDPSKQSLIQAGDFASSTGRSFQELSEALLNIGELEVWKKFGVTAVTSGDKLKLSFRGLTMEVEKSTEGVLKAVDAFGSMKGIAGSMQAQMETLGGKVSNMKDAYDQLLNSLGESKGWKNSVTWLTEFIDKANDFVKGTERLSAENATTSINKFTDSLKGLSRNDAVKAINEKIADLQATATLVATDIKNDLKSQNWLFPSKETNDRIKINKELLGSYQQQIQSLKSIVDRPAAEFDKWYDKMFSPTPPPKPPVLGLLEALNKQLKDYKEKRETVGSEAEIAIIDRQTESIKKQIAVLEAGVKRINDVNYASKGAALSPVANAILNKPLSVSPISTTPKDQYAIDTYTTPLNHIQKFAAEEQLKQYQSLFDSIDKLNQDQLRNKLKSIQTELKGERVKGEERIKLEKQVADIVKKLDEDSFNSTMDIAQAIGNLGNAIGGELGGAFQKMSTGFQSAANGFKSFTAEGATLGQKILGSVDILTGGVSTIMTLGNLATQLGETLSGTADYEKQRKESLEKEKLILQEMTTELIRQLDLTKEMKGESRITSYTNLINEAMAGQAESLKALNQIMPFIGEGRSRNSTLNWTIEQWRNIAQGDRFSAELKAQFDEAIAKYDDFSKQLQDLINTQNADLTGSTYDSILSGIEDAFADGSMSADEFSNNFEGAMKKAVMNTFSRTFLEKQLQSWYDSFADASKDGLTPDEIAALNDDLKKKMDDAQIGWDNLTKGLGLDFSNSSNTTTTTGAIKNIQEDTANLINGNMNAIRINVIAQKDIALQAYQQLTKIELNTRPIAEIRDLIKANSSNSLINSRANGE
jgi:phage tail tape-measure protein